MSYSIVGILALIINLTINHETFKDMHKRSRELKAEQPAVFRYAHFLMVANLYFISDIGWGFLYAHHENDAIFPFLYSDTVFYFIFMFMTMLAWMRYVVAYLDRRGRGSKALLYAVWALFTLALINLMINRFYPFIFSFNEKHEYVEGSGRHIAFLLLIILYMITSTYLLLIAHKTVGAEKVRYRAVGFTCLVMELFLIAQILDTHYPCYATGLIIGISLIHSFVEASERKEKEVYDHIATGLAEGYEAMYYIDTETSEFREFAIGEEYKSLNVFIRGRDFFAEAQRNIDIFVHPDDREFAHSLYFKEAMLNNLEGKKSFSYKYRIMVNGNPRYFLFTVMRAHDDRHLVLCEKDIEDDFVAEKIRLETQKKNATFSRIAESLAANYDVVYYVDAADGSFISYQCKNIYGILDVDDSGDDFFEDARTKIAEIVHKGDREQVSGFLNRDYFITTLKDRKSCSLDYRIVADNKTHYVRLTVHKTADGTHYIIGIENIDEEVKKEKQHLKALKSEKELARRDELTGIKNKTAYKELEQSVQANMDNGMDYLPFAIVVCDANNFKTINDTLGHVAGDEYIKNSAMLLCHIFEHSPVFRVGGDEFVVFLRGNDFTNRIELMNTLRGRVMENKLSGTGPIVASGMATYDPKTDTLVSEIFDRADKDMYNNKQMLKKDA